MGLYENIKKAASERGSSINKLEHDLGLPRSSISKYNKNSPSIDKVQKIADFLEVPLEYLTTGERKRENDGYYLREETATIAQQLFENRDLRVLFDSAKDASPEDLKTTHDLLMALKKKERGTSDD